MQIVDDERLLLRFDRKLQIAPRAPPERLEPAPLSAIGDKNVAHADELLAFYLVAIALLSQAGKPQRLGIAQRNGGILAAAHGQLRITRCQKGLVVQQRNARVRRDLM